MTPAYYLVLAMAWVVASIAGGLVVTHFLIKKTAVTVTHSMLAVRADGGVDVVIQVLADGPWGHFKWRHAGQVPRAQLEEVISSVVTQLSHNMARAAERRA